MRPNFETVKAGNVYRVLDAVSRMNVISAWMGRCGVSPHGG